MLESIEIAAMQTVDAVPSSLARDIPLNKNALTVLGKR